MKDALWTGVISSEDWKLSEMAELADQVDWLDLKDVDAKGGKVEYDNLLGYVSYATIKLPRDVMASIQKRPSFKKVPLDVLLRHNLPVFAVENLKTDHS